ncbi:MAG: NAD(P)H-hydrate dehydratase [Nitrospirae bacterium]|nr:MAG: NAD(P)H-hydrate dehydratase [Nitrospirota bacterium]
MRIVTAEEMRDIDRRTIRDYGISGRVLMERAGLLVAEKVAELFEKKKVLVLAGSGNNGGDGLVAARELSRLGWQVKALLPGRKEKLSADCLVQLRAAQKAGVSAEFRSGLDEKDLHAAIIIDALFGTGLNKPVSPALAGIMRQVNRSGRPVVSVDIPSGIAADDGRVMGEAVRADLTVTFGLPKRGHLIHPGAEYTGRLIVGDIGFPAELLRPENLRARLIGRDEVIPLIPERPALSHKGDYGHVLVVAGSRGRTGAALMAAKACLRTGAGMVTLGVPETLTDVFQARVTEEMVLPLPDDGHGGLSIRALGEILSFISSKADVAAVGPGLGVTADTAGLIEQMVRTVTVPMVLDADGLNALGSKSGALKKAKAPVICTPHTGELARLLDAAAGIAGHDRARQAELFAKGHSVCLVSKGAPTIVADPSGLLFFNSTGNPGMATAGAGDVLTGMIAGLLGQGLPPAVASVAGVYLHGLSGDLAAAQKGMHSLIASDIIEHIPAAFLSLRD